MRLWLVNSRETRNMTHEEVSIQCGITRQFYSMIENSERSPSVETAKKIAKVLGFDWTKFYDTESETKEVPKQI